MIKTYLWCANNKISEQLILSSSLESFKAVRLSLKNLCAMIDLREYHRFKRSDFEILRIIYLIKNIECNNSLAFSQQIRFQEVANITADLEPLCSHKLEIKLLEALVKSLGGST